VAQDALDKRVGAVKKEARLNGIRPMTIERLLAFLGYDMNTPVMGRVEAVDANAMRRLTAPRRPTDQQPKATSESTKAAPKAEDEMKDEKPKAEPKKKAEAKKVEDDAAADDKEPK
jgi:hypothetical protein